MLCLRRSISLPPPSNPVPVCQSGELQDSSSLSGYTTDFQGDTVLDFVVPTGFSVADTITINNAGVTTSAGNNFTNFKVGDVIQYQRPGFSTATYNRVSSITADGLKMTLSAVVNVKGVCDGSLPSSTTTVQFRRGRSSIRNEEQGFLYAPLDDGNIATVDFTGSDLKAVVEATGKTTNSSGVLTLSASDIGGLTDILLSTVMEKLNHFVMIK